MGNLLQPRLSAAAAHRTCFLIGGLGGGQIPNPDRWVRFEGGGGITVTSSIIWLLFLSVSLLFFFPSVVSLRCCLAGGRSGPRHYFEAQTGLSGHRIEVVGLGGGSRPAGSCSGRHLLLELPGPRPPSHPLPHLPGSALSVTLLFSCAALRDD